MLRRLVCWAFGLVEPPAEVPAAALTEAPPAAAQVTCAVCGKPFEDQQIPYDWGDRSLAHKWCGMRASGDPHFGVPRASPATDGKADEPPPLAVPVAPTPAPENAPVPQNALAAQVCAFAQRRLGQKALGEWLLERGDQRGLRVLAECPQPWEQDMLAKKQRSTTEVAQEIRERILGLFPEAYHAPSGQFLVATDKANTLRLVPSVAPVEGEGG